MQYVQSIMKEAGLATRLQELEINKQEIVEPLLEEMNEERFANNPVPFNKSTLKELILQYL